MSNYHYVVHVTQAPSPLNVGDYVKIKRDDNGEFGYVDWLVSSQMTGWLPGTGSPQVNDLIGITLTEAHATSLGWEATTDNKLPKHLPGCFTYDAHPLRLDAVSVWLRHPRLGTRSFRLGDDVELAHARPVEGVRARASFRADLAAELGEAAGEPWTVVWRTAQARVRTGQGWSAPRPLCLSAHLAGPAEAPARPGEEGWANLHVAAGFGPGA